MAGSARRSSDTDRDRAKPRSPQSFLGNDHLEWVRRLFVPLISRPVMQIEAESPEVGDRELERDVCVAVLLQQRQQLR